MNFLVVGTSYKYAPIEIRERIAFTKRRLAEAVSFFGNVVILSTCNRVEIYTDADLDLRWLLCRYHEVHPKDIYPYLYRYEGREAFIHMCKVASGLDSQIFGENEILGQVRFAYNTAKPKGLLNKMFVDAFRVARKIRRNMNADVGIVNTVASFLGQIEGKRIIVIGRGEVAKGIVRKLSEVAPHSIILSEVQPHSTWLYKEADIIVSATGSPHIVIKKEDLPEKPLIILDLAVPRDVDPRVKEIKGVQLFNLDDVCGDLVLEKANLQLSR